MKNYLISIGRVRVAAYFLFPINESINFSTQVLLKSICSIKKGNIWLIYGLEPL